MATARDTIRTALRKLGVVGQGQWPSPEEQADALGELNAMLSSWLGSVVGLPFDDLRIVSTSTVSPRWPSQRLLCQHGSALSITLPRGSLEMPVPDGMLVAVIDAGRAAGAYPITIVRNGWQIDGAQANAVIATAGGSKTLMHRADLGDWRSVADIAAGDDLPYPDRFHHGIALCLSEMLQGEYGRSLAPPDVAMARSTRASLTALYKPPPRATFDLGATLLGGAHHDGFVDAESLGAYYDGAYNE